MGAYQNYFICENSEQNSCPKLRYYTKYVLNWHCSVRLYYFFCMSFVLWFFPHPLTDVLKVILSILKGSRNPWMRDSDLFWDSFLNEREDRLDIFKFPYKYPKCMFQFFVVLKICLMLSDKLLMTAHRRIFEIKYRIRNIPIKYSSDTTSKSKYISKIVEKQTRWFCKTKC